MMKMKLKFNALLVVAFFCSFGLNGCDKDMMETTEPNTDEVQMHLSADGPQTRVGYTESGSDMLFSWHSGDEVSTIVEGVVGNENRKLTSSSSGKNVVFNGSVSSWSGTKNIYVIYPYSLSAYNYAGSSSNAITILTLPNPQLYTIDGPLKNCFLVGAGTATASGNDINASCSMKQVMSLIKLNITNAPGKVTGVKLISSHADFPTIVNVKLADATITSTSDYVNTLSMDVTDPTTSADKKVSFAMYPTNLTGKTITIEVTFEGGYMKSIAKTGINFLRNKHYNVAFDATGSYSYVELGGVKWATGNLIADGTNDAKIGAPTDGGLYFSFGSLIGWSGGATGDGTGRGTDLATPTLEAKVVPNGYSGGTPVWNPTSTGNTFSDNAAAGTGDPCRHYLGITWRLPTNDEYIALITATPGYPSTGPWVNEGVHSLGSVSSYLVHNSTGLKFPASGRRHQADGGLSGVGQFGLYWSSTNFDATVGYSLAFNGSLLVPNDHVENRATAFPVRCVHN